MFNSSNMMKTGWKFDLNIYGYFSFGLQWTYHKTGCVFHQSLKNENIAIDSDNNYYISSFMKKY